jgi:hypothetical protein
MTLSPSGVLPATLHGSGREVDAAGGNASDGRCRHCTILEGRSVRPPGSFHHPPPSSELAQSRPGPLDRDDSGTMHETTRP